MDIIDLDNTLGSFLHLEELENLACVNKDYNIRYKKYLKKREFDKKFVDNYINFSYIKKDEEETAKIYIMENFNDILHYLQNKVECVNNDRIMNDRIIRYSKKIVILAHFFKKHEPNKKEKHIKIILFNIFLCLKRLENEKKHTNFKKSIFGKILKVKNLLRYDEKIKILDDEKLIKYDKEIDLLLLKYNDILIKRMIK
jgi:hypothetical protein